MTETTSLSEHWNGKSEENDLSGVHLLVDESVDDKEMACGGRQELDRRLRLPRENRIVQPCGECIVSSRCLLALDRV